MNASKGASSTGQMMVDQRPVFDGGHRPRKTIFSRKGGVYRPTKKARKAKFL